ncbi:unnamed protein product [Amaranthus hypochondriacus]
MGNFSILYALFLLITLNPSTNTMKQVKCDEEFIKKTCKNTKFFNLCISSLKSDPTSSISDLKGLATIMINIGMANASQTYTYLSSQIPTRSDHNTKVGVGVGVGLGVFQFCASKYSLANDSLKSSLQDLGLDNYDYARMDVMGAADYTNVCHNAFKRLSGVTYPAFLKAREDGFNHICSIVLGIIDQLSNVNNNNN